MPSKANEYTPGVRLSNAAKAPMAPGAPVPTGSIGLPGGGTLTLPRNIVQPKATVSMADAIQPPPAQPTMAVPQYGQQAVQARQQVRPQTAPQSGYVAPSMGSVIQGAAAPRPVAQTQSYADTAANQGQSGGDAWGAGALVDQAQQQAAQAKSGFQQAQQQNQQTYGYTPEQYKAKSDAIYSQATLAAQQQQAAISDYYARRGLSGSGMEQAAIAATNQKAQEDIANQMAQFELESSKLAFDQKMAWENLQNAKEQLRLSGMQVQSELLDSGFQRALGVMEDLDIPSGQRSQFLQEFSDAIAGGGDPNAVVQKFLTAWTKGQDQRAAAASAQQHADYQDSSGNGYWTWNGSQYVYMNYGG